MRYARCRWGLVLALGALILVTVITPFGPVHAQTAPQTASDSLLSIGLSPVKTAFDLIAGSSTTFPATFRVAGTAPVRATVRFMDALSRGSAGGFEYQEPGNEFWSAAAWLSVDQAEFGVEPGGRRDFRITISVPPGTPDGEYYAAYFVDAQAHDADNSTVNLRGSLGAVVCIAVGESIVRTARLVPYGYQSWTSPDAFWARLGNTLRHWWLSLVIDERLVAPLTEGGGLTVFVPIENTCRSHIQPRVTVQFYEGDVLRRTVVYEGEIILPEQARLIEVPWPDAPLFGRFRLVLEVEYGGAEPIMEERSFLVVPIKGVLGLVALAFGLGYLSATRGRGRAPGLGGSRRTPAG